MLLDLLKQELNNLSQPDFNLSISEKISSIIKDTLGIDNNNFDLDINPFNKKINIKINLDQETFTNMSYKIGENFQVNISRRF